MFFETELLYHTLLHKNSCRYFVDSRVSATLPRLLKHATRDLQARQKNLPEVAVKFVVILCRCRSKTMLPER